MDLNATPVGAGEFALSDSASSETSASVAAAGSHFLVAWQTQDDPSRIFGSSIDDNGAFDLKDTPISHSTEAAGQPAVVSSGGQYLVAWTDGRDSHRFTARAYRPLAASLVRRTSSSPLAPRATSHSARIARRSPGAAPNTC